jgi:hypothetical protein
VGLVLGVGAVAHAGVRATGRSDPRRADTSRATQQRAIRLIPIEKLDADARQKVASVLSGAHIFRRMPIHVTQCDPDLYLFLVRHPDVVVNIWRTLGISRLRMEQTGQDGYRVSDGHGTTGTVRFLYQDHDTHVIYTEGRYEGPLFSRPVRGRSLIVLKSAYVREPDGRYYITSRADCFTHIEHAGVEFLTRTFQPLVGKVADTNFKQTSAFLGSLSRTAEVNYRGVQRLADKLDRVRPEVRKELALLAKRIAAKAAIQVAHHAPSHPTVAANPPGTRRR